MSASELPSPSRELSLSARELALPSGELSLPARELSLPTRKLSLPARELLAAQGDAIARRQSATAEVAARAMRTRVTNEKWQRLQRGVYAAYSGNPSRESMLWAALLRVGNDAVLSHQTAAERHGLTDEPSRFIMITVPAARHPGRWSEIPGVVVHRSDSVLRTRHPAMVPPCTRVEDTVLDLVGVAATLDDAYAWIARAIGRRRTTADRINLAMAARKKMRWRREIAAALGDAAGGALSVLEYRYVSRVERPHGLPAARRQARIVHGRRSSYLDNLYEEFGVCVELDGTAAHPADEQWRDKRRDNANAVNGIVTLRFGFMDLGDMRCDTARTVAAVLQRRGWTGFPNPCGHGCQVAPS